MEFDMTQDTQPQGISIQLIMMPVLAIALGTAFLYFAAPIMIPLVLAISLAYVLLPLVELVKKLKVPHWLAVLIVSIIVLGLLALVAFFIVLESADFLSTLPQYKDQIIEKAKEWNASISQYMGQFEGFFKKPDNLAVDTDKMQSIGHFLLKGISSVTNFVVGGVTLFFLVIFMLMESELFSRKLKRIFGSEHAGATERILNEISRQMKAYIQVRFYGFLGISLVTTIGLLFLDVQYAYIWGPLAGVLNIIPYIGSFAGAIPPIIVAGIQHNSVMSMVYVAIFFLVIQMIEGNIIMPKLTSSSVDLNAVTVLVSLMYWGWIWGGIGLILSVPITAAIKVVCDNIEPLKPLGLIMGTERSDPKEIPVDEPMPE
jgi:AI-2 transport protein TqsA